eukprot:CAMPEP_0179111616 /NCGR_PEP_ID=MMETSP0796-20121207/52138_1 /TAXON_ID=73915 /ORGANISM="Pyrodinium bahamense, Strain pbaha01" /LENGTH=67 /DNA_ID=CAMNT_0020809765 /DNA_START=28 /DNA_END=231 /DNA_ORIENTATION=-
MSERVLYRKVAPCPRFRTAEERLPRGGDARAGAREVRDPRRDGAYAKHQTEGVAEVAAVALQDVVVL